MVLGLSLAGAHAQLDQPPPRETPALTADEVSKLKKDLTITRDRQNSQVKAKEATPAPKKSKKP
ncbi:hypothetical protein [Bradyrhizobium sp.]|uniref:hypothetical protein n=1 Tax=Bradyrhizobium sp. TaxID=376 RepID=UPI002D46EFE9|nr:hypothetical protein [Bradyrhizobium sp.]HZR71829.1 hypothetical protein [Bradyrhizobium sp.]